MMINEELKFLGKNLDRLNDGEIRAVYEKIKNEFMLFYKNKNKYTANYNGTIDGIISSFNISEEISTNHGGKKYQDEDKNSIYKRLLDFYNRLMDSKKYLDFLREEKRNVIFVGANGSGKTTLLRKLKQTTGDTSIGYFQAERLNINNTQYQPKRDKSAFDQNLKNEYGYATDNSSDHQGHYIINIYDQYIALFEKERSIENDKSRSDIDIENKTDKILKYWNELIKDRELYSEGELKVKLLGGNSYPIKNMSSGEKSILFFLIGIILTEEKKFYFIDEPENNLNPSVVLKLWNILESERPNSIFVYLTHDANFANSRINNKLYWIQKYDGTEWIYKELPYNEELPQRLIIELIGNREPIIFCESEDSDKYDYMVLSKIFPGFKIVPSGGCDKVIQRTKAYKELGLPNNAFGLIDMDYRELTYLEGQKSNNVFYLPFHEIENFLVSELILNEIIKNYSTIKDDEVKIKEDIKNKVAIEFKKNKDVWITRHVAFMLKEKYYRGKIKDLNNIQQLKERVLSDSIIDRIDEKTLEMEKLYNELVERNDYDMYLKYYDNKGIFQLIESHLKLEDYNYDEAIRKLFSQESIDFYTEIKNKYFQDIK